jgi:hypothetical protein
MGNINIDLENQRLEPEIDLGGALEKCCNSLDFV